MPPVGVAAAQQLVSFALAGPTLKYAANRLYARLSDREARVILEYPNGQQILLVSLVAIAFGFVINGARGARNIGIINQLPKGPRQYVEEGPPQGFEDWSPKAQLADTMLRGGLIGVGIHLKTRLRGPSAGNPSAIAVLEFLGLETEGKFKTWLMEIGASMVYIPLMALASGRGLHLSFFISALIVSAFTNLSNAFISSNTAPHRFAEANVIRQLFFFIQNSIALLAGKGTLPPLAAFLSQLTIVSSAFLGLKRAKSFLTRLLGEPRSV